MLIRCLCIAIMLSSVALAQKDDRRRVQSTAFRKQEVIKDDVAASRWRMGNLYISPIIGLRQLGYDSNVYSTEENQVDDFAIAPEVGLRTFYRPGSRWIWENRLTYDYLYYADQDSLRGSEYGGESRIHGLFKKAYFDMGVLYNRDRQRLTSEIEDRVISEQLTANIHYSYQPGARTQVDLTASISTLAFDDLGENLLFKELERDTEALNFRYHLKWKKSFWPFLELDYQSFDFKSIDNPREDTRFTGLFLGIRTHGSRRLSMEGKIGTQKLDFKEAAGEDNLDENLVALEGFMRYRITRKYYIQGTALRTPLFSISQFDTYFISNRITMEMGVETRRKIRIGPEILLGSNDYESIRKDDITGINLNVTFPFKRAFEWKISAGYLERDSNIPLLSDDGFQVTSSIKYKKFE